MSRAHPATATKGQYPVSGEAGVELHSNKNNSNGVRGDLNPIIAHYDVIASFA